MLLNSNDASPYPTSSASADSRSRESWIGKKYDALRRELAERAAAGRARLREQYAACNLLLIGPAVVVAAAAVIVAYAIMLSRMGVAASTPALLAVLLASTLSSIAGFAFSAICGVMLLHMVSDHVQVVEIMMVCSIAIQSLSVAMLWRSVVWRDLARFVGGGLVGLPLGVWLLLHLGHVGFRDAVGGLLAAYAAYALFKRPLTIRRAAPLADWCAGFLGGTTGGLAGFPGAPVAIWCGMRGWDKQRQRGVYQPFILIVQLAGLALIQIMRTTAAHSDAFGIGALQFVPVALLGTWFGLTIFRRLSDRGFALTINLLLLVSGFGLLV
jgi:uncharacterized protein